MRSQMVWSTPPPASPAERRMVHRKDAGAWGKGAVVLASVFAVALGVGAVARTGAGPGHRDAMVSKAPVLAATGAGSGHPESRVSTTPPIKAWRIQGKLSEACTCSVPCTCNFGGTPSPAHYCHAIFSLDIEKGRHGDVTLDGLHLAGGNAAKGSVWYIDDRASTSQEAALRDIANTINAKLVSYWKGVDPKIIEDPQFIQLGFKRMKIVQKASEKGSLLEIGEAGRFESDFILGIDGKTPIMVENNWSWNIKHGIKGKTRKLEYHDEYGNLIDASATNANQGLFDWSDTTPIYLR